MTKTILGDQDFDFISGRAVEIVFPYRNTNRGYLLDFAKMEEMARFIANYAHKAVKVRLNGRRNKQEFSLSNTQKQTIKETVEFFDALAVLRKAGVDPQSIK